MRKWRARRWRHNAPPRTHLLPPNGIAAPPLAVARDWLLAVAGAECGDGMGSEGGEMKRFSDKRLRKFIHRAEKQITHKNEVMTRHRPGSAYHTRARRELAALRKRVREWEGQIGS